MRKLQAMPWLSDPSTRTLACQSTVYAAPAIEPLAVVEARRGPCRGSRTGRDAPQIDFPENERRTHEAGWGIHRWQRRRSPPQRRT